MDDEPRNNGVKTRKQMPEGVRFQPGNPGRPKGSRNKLGEAFTQALLADFEREGETAIERVRVEDPAAYLRVIASVVPKEIHVEQSPVEELTDDELGALIAAVRQAEAIQISARSGAGSSGSTH